MYDAELKRMRELIRARRYVMTLHAEDGRWMPMA